MKIEFELTKDHITLLQNLNIGGSIDSDAIWGDIVISEHYPFYDKEIMESMAMILEMPGIETDAGDIAFPRGTLAKCRRIYNELATALEVCLQAKSFVPGIYTRLDDSITYADRKWKRMKK